MSAIAFSFDDDSAAHFALRQALASRDPGLIRKAFSFLAANRAKLLKHTRFAIAQESCEVSDLFSPAGRAVCQGLADMMGDKPEAPVAHLSSDILSLAVEYASARNTGAAEITIRAVRAAAPHLSVAERARIADSIRTKADTHRDHIAAWSALSATLAQ